MLKCYLPNFCAFLHINQYKYKTKKNTWTIKTIMNSDCYCAVLLIVMIQLNSFHVKSSKMKVAVNLEFRNISSPCPQLICSADCLHPTRGGNSWPFYPSSEGLESRRAAACSASCLCWLFFIVWCLSISQTASNCYWKLRVCFSWAYTMLLGLLFVFLHVPTLLLSAILCFLLIIRKAQRYNLCILGCVTFTCDADTRP